MKRFIMIMGMLVTTAAYSNAQQVSQPGTTVVVSKSDFGKKVSDLNQLLANDKLSEAKDVFEEITKMAYTEIGALRDKSRAAATEADKKKYSDLTMSQRLLFSEVLKLRDDMANNKKPINDKLNEFKNKMD